jgi:hypothetical protein
VWCALLKFGVIQRQPKVNTGLQSALTEPWSEVLVWAGRERGGGAGSQLPAAAPVAPVAAAESCVVNE